MLRKKGFTLIELIIAISIVVILASIFAYLLINSPASKARNAGRLSDSDRLRKNLEIYRSENDKYPETGDPDDWKKLEEDADANGPFYQAMITFLKNIPRDPLYGKNNDGKDYGFYYKTTNNGDCYKIHIEMEKRDPYEISGICGSEIAYDVVPSGGGGDDGDGGGDGDGDTLQLCIDNSQFTIRLWWPYQLGESDDIQSASKATVPDIRPMNRGWLSDYCSGRNSRVSLYTCIDDADPNCTDRQLLGSADSIIATNGDNVNETWYDFNPDISIIPIEWWEYEIF